ncbi:sigma-70 family RNA polymerase sigma factor [Halobacillus salinarum]|uniref:Sigma-70 family RNA polymerase sigma factor n=1 Tax=Halobacillus salinarum TaxID=2932257 RepID=A0ABY4EKE4_9BACI|nr:sigma-70 family RNA polymerase sigma factor [Halobacillus salinarum]UOQ44450.1 sigma-70 family RNA polymerase sigma factor [Halobacillus salinarum]
MKERNATLESAVEQNYSFLLRTAHSYVKDAMVAEDMVQDALLKALEKFTSFQKTHSFQPWLFKIMVNQCKDYLRSYSNKHVSPWEDHWLSVHKVDTKEPMDVILRKETSSWFYDQMQLLSTDHFEVLYLYYFEDLSIKEISTRTGIKENTLKTRMKRARERLKERLTTEK